MKNLYVSQCKIFTCYVLAEGHQFLQMDPWEMKLYGIEFHVTAIFLVTSIINIFFRIFIAKTVKIKLHERLCSNEN